jgi:alpha-galactosidase
MQGQTYGLSSWIPLSAAATYATDPYRFRSGLGAGVILCTGLEPYRFRGGLGVGAVLGTALNHPQQLKALVEQARWIEPYFLGDYYPLTPYSVADTDWLAMQFNRPEQADGVVLAYRRPACSGESVRLKLHGLDPAARYEIRSLDEGAATVASGKSLLDGGLLVNLPSKPAAAVIRYQRTARTAPR